MNGQALVKQLLRFCGILHYTTLECKAEGQPQLLFSAKLAQYRQASAQQCCAFLEAKPATAKPPLEGEGRAQSDVRLNSLAPRQTS
jgi:hypothetical protein